MVYGAETLKDWWRAGKLPSLSATRSAFYTLQPAHPDHASRECAGVNL